MSTLPVPDRRRSHQCVPPNNCNWCVRCGGHVVHEELAEDTFHCPCRRNATNGHCNCPCHLVPRQV